MLATDIHGPMTQKLIFGPVDSWLFVDWLFEELQPMVNPYPQRRSIVILDNIKFHRNRLVQLFQTQTQCVILHLPRYSPYLNLAEYLFNAIKARCRNMQSVGFFQSMVTILTAVQEMRNRNWAGLLRDLEYI